MADTQTAFEADAFQNNAFQIGTTNAPSAWRRYRQQMGLLEQQEIFLDHLELDDEDTLLLL